MSGVIITNNPLVKEELENELKHELVVEYYNVDYLEILKIVRDKVHIGYKLLTHPLSGSVKPNETPYKSILISKYKGNLDYDSLSIIEGSIQTTLKFLKNMKTPLYNEKISKDFQIIDKTLITNAINNINF